MTPPLYFYRTPTYLSPSQLFHNLLHRAWEWASSLMPAEQGSVVLLAQLSARITLPHSNSECSLWRVPSAAAHLQPCSTLNLFSDLLTWNLSVIVALNCSLRLSWEYNEFTRDLILKVQPGYKPYLLCSRTVDTGTVSSLNPGKKAPGSKPDFVDIFNYVLLVKQ